ncbi:hypothetical protein [Petrocella sp. FN5]|uniref:hypothetical protein n=1 Tax=Petrocella sp. FN5 TaxID=3032002 RepID=UPI0023DB7D2A|nr:hypothetical protein [Petrocella sp. FN5]MDF1618120.1 hypothetical protein [Petrocella sp. FN5]
MESKGIFTVNEDGSIEVPSYLLEDIGLDPNKSYFMEVIDDGIKIHSNIPDPSKKKKTPKPRM